MFWGTVIKQGKPFIMDKDDLSRVIHISNASLGINPSSGRNTLLAVGGPQKIVLGALEKDKRDHILVDLFIRYEQEIQLQVIGKSEIHLSGFYEPVDETSDEEDSDE